MIKGTASPQGHRQKTGSSTYNVHRVVDLGQGSEPTCEAAPSNLGLTQFTRFFPVPANVFQIQSLFVPTHEALLVRWPFRSNHSAYLRGKMRHLLCPPVCRKRVFGWFPSQAEYGATHSRQAKYTPQSREILLGKITRKNYTGLAMPRAFVLAHRTRVM